MPSHVEMLALDIQDTLNYFRETKNNERDEIRECKKAIKEIKLRIRKREYECLEDIESEIFDLELSIEGSQKTIDHTVSEENRSKAD